MNLMHWISLKLAALGAVVALFSGCAAIETSISKKDLVVQSKTSTAIFVEPVARASRTVYVEVRSGVAEFDRRTLSNFIKNEFTRNENGYRIVDEPEEAAYTMSVYVLNLEQTNVGAAQAALQRGYSGEATLGASAGALIGSNRGSYRDGAAGALVGSALASGTSLMANALVKDVTFMLVCDTQVDTKVSDAGSNRQTVSEVTNRKEYRTRVVTTANKANLKLEEAKDSMFSKTAYALAGFF
jgi:hypothetical protein